MNTSGYPLVRTKNILLGKVLGTCAFAVLLCFSALIRIPLPFTPVPVTLQNFVVCLAAALLGPWGGFSAVFLYVALGALGTPLFANAGAGLAYLCGPTGGYIIGFFAASLLIGYILRTFKTKNIFFLYAVMLAGMAVVHFFGGLWLSVGYGWSMRQIFSLGVLPFIAPDAAKAFLAAVTFISLRGRH